jgi:hypothetical protein
MLIIKPYGKTVVQEVTLANRSFISHNQNAQEQPQTIENMVTSDNKAVIAQWISCIDKIIKKPKAKDSASQAQHNLRIKIGDQAWKIICEKSLITSTKEKSIEQLKQIWDWKIKPYDVKENQNCDDNELKGRWYKKFVGKNIEPSNIDDEVAKQVAENIYQFLYQDDNISVVNQKGFIQRRSLSIEKKHLT